MSTAAPSSILLQQPSLNGFCPVTEAVKGLSIAGIEARGAIFTRREVVDFILDLAGYVSSKPLSQFRVLEPAFGSGDFLIPMVERLLDSWEFIDHSVAELRRLGNCLRAVEVHEASFETTKTRVILLMVERGFSRSAAEMLANRWLIQGDFLLVDLPREFDFVVGNPPYVRQELIPEALMTEYRARYRTIYDRADLYIPFIERSLSLLSGTGTLGFICADRWMKNRYGGPLRQMIAEDFHLRIFVDMVNTPAFHSDVIAYPGIVIISRERSPDTRVAIQPDIGAPALSALAAVLLSSKPPGEKSSVRALRNIASGSEPWILDSADEVALIRRLESAFPTLTEAGCKVGIGVATGADRAFIGEFETLDVEPDRKLRLVMTRDILTGTVDWKGYGVVNPFMDDGRLVNLAEFPRLRRYFEERKDEIAGRHVAKKAPDNWYRTIDRITPSLSSKPKLLIPDIKGDAHVVYEKGQLYPHHNLYYITSDEWDLRALQAVLLSGIARLFVSVYSTKMHGGFLRFQAQYLRRIRLPEWTSVSAELQKRLTTAAKKKDVDACNQAVVDLYELTATERLLLKSNGTGNGD